MLDQIVGILTGVAAAYPRLTAVFAVLYVVGLGIKLIREALEAFVKQSPSKKDDAWLEGLQKKKAYKAIAFIADLFLRLKGVNKSAAPVKSP